jgi:nicotinate dehydrogenase subunit A
MATFQFRVNGSAKTVQTDDPSTPLLYVLRNDLDLTGTHFGCGLAQCGACTVHVDGRAARSCSVTVSAVHGKSVTTIEGLGSPEKPDPLQEARDDFGLSQIIGGFDQGNMLPRAEVERTMRRFAEQVMP